MEPSSLNKENLIKLSKLDFERYYSLPVAVYITDKETGTFLDFNDAAKILFSLNQQDKGKASIVPFYRDIKDRNYVIKCLEKVVEESAKSKKECWDSNHTLEFNIKGKKINLKFHAKPYVDDKENLLGSLSIAFLIPEIERFHNLQENMPIGIFEIGIDQTLTYSNAKFNELLGIENNTEKLLAFKFFDRQEDYNRIYNDLQLSDAIYETGAVVLKKLDNYKLLVNMIISPQYSSSKKLVKLRGVLRDLTNYEILTNAPIGIYLAMKKDGEDIIMKANKEWARIFEFDDEQSCIGFSVKKLHIDEESQNAFLTALSNASKNGKRLENYPLEVTTLKGNRRHLKLNVTNYKHKVSKEVIGRIGIALDVTNDINNVLESWKKDYAGFLHSYSNMLISMRDTINSVISGHATDVFNDRRVDIGSAFKSIEINIKKLREHWLLLFDEIKQKEIPFSENKIQKALDDLDKKEEAGLKEKAAWIRLILKKIRSELNIQLKNQKLHKEILKNVQNDISEILRYARLISLSLVVDDIPEVLTDINTFKSILMDGDDNAVEFKDVNITEVINDVTKSLDDFAQSKGAILKKRYSIERQLVVNGAQRELYSAFYNIIHNAIKYSRTDDEFGKLTIDIFIGEENGMIEVKVSNLGIPIRKKEWADKLIFKFGFRGADSMKGGRKGSGIGLWHANKIIDQHSGVINIESKAINYNGEEDYTKLFKTTVKVLIPIKSLWKH